MRAMSRRLQAVVAVAAGCLLPPSYVVAGPVQDGSLEYGPVLISRIVSRQDLQFKTANGERAGVLTTVLAYQAPGAMPSPVAVMTFSRSGDATHVSIHRLPFPKSAADIDDVNLATIEHLYTLVLRQDPEAKFFYSDGEQRFDSDTKNSRSHSELLRELARARQDAVGQGKRVSTSVPWHVVSMAPAGVDHADPDKVSVRITSDRQAMDGVTVFFNRAPHSGCVAKSARDGIAICRLVDPEDDSHPDEDKIPVLATYPGEVRADGVLLPTTLVMSARR